MEKYAITHKKKKKKTSVDDDDDATLFKLQFLSIVFGQKTNKALSWSRDYLKRTAKLAYKDIYFLNIGFKIKK